ncbi:hypothetical protein J5X07_03825 [Actinomyces bowdenii]|nr:hypothetical protein [Actinomyces bowdenii]MBO3724169.1 hypothetical protein [Actinomyces bowdenii]
MALRFNPPPNWPAPPEGFQPPAGWQPDPAWGPAPEGWQLWVDDSASSGGSASSAPAAASGADPAWAPTQAVSTGATAPVADPTGQSASVPPGDFPSPAPAGGASPYAPSGDYAQSPTPFQNQAAPQGVPSAPGAPGGWQPMDVGGQPGYAAAAAKPITKQWWFWAIIAGTLVVVLVLGMVIVNSLGSSGDNNSRGGSSSSQGSGSGTSDKSDKSDSDSSDSSDDSDSSANKDQPGTDPNNPADPDSSILTFTAGKYSSNKGATADVEITEVKWDATAEVEQGQNKYSYEAPPEGSVYVRAKVKLTYHGSGQFNEFDFKMDYTKDGNTVEATRIYDMADEFAQQAMPRDGGSAEGYITFAIPKENANTGAWAISVFGGDELYMAAK